MEYTHLGRSGLRVSRLVLGTMNFGPETDEADLHAIMDAALEYGINFFDTANVYGWGENKGRTEDDHRQLVRPGRRPAGQDGARHQGLRNMAPRATRWPNHDKLSALNIRRAVRRLARAGCRPTTSTSTSSTTWTGTPRGRRSGRRWTSSSSRARSSTPARPTSPAGTSPRPTRPPPAGTRSASSASSASTTCSTREAEMEVIPAAQEYGLGRHPVVPAARRAARRRAAQGARGQSAGLAAAAAPRDRRAPRADPARTRTCARSTAWSRATSALAWLLTRPGGDRADRRPAHDASSSTARCGRWSWSWRTRCWTGWTRSSPATRPRPSTTPGRHGLQRGVGRRVPTVSPGVPRQAAIVSYRGAEPWWLRMSTTSPAVKCGPA